MDERMIELFVCVILLTVKRCGVAPLLQQSGLHGIGRREYG